MNAGILYISMQILFHFIILQRVILFFPNRFRFFPLFKFLLFPFNPFLCCTFTTKSRQRDNFLSVGERKRLLLFMRMCISLSWFRGYLKWALTCVFWWSPSLFVFFIDYKTFKKLLLFLFDFLMQFLRENCIKGVSFLVSDSCNSAIRWF